ncbi:MAG: hypothetical protein HY706_13355 [Candidatus Hydrogenedentes bacterium]|nr:hypothetical protein [Candidatus Hydrogenedentota bacterium]
MLKVIVVIVVVLVLACMTARAEQLRIAVDKERVGMGRSMELKARVKATSKSSTTRYELHPYVNGRRWGAHEFADAQGRATFHIPLPNPGGARVQVALIPLRPEPQPEWIWTKEVKDGQTVYLQHVFDVRGVPKKATVWMAADDAATVMLNGQVIGNVAGWSSIQLVEFKPELFERGPNALSVEAKNSTGPAGFILWMVLEIDGGPITVISTPQWRAFDAPPSGWPNPTPDAGAEIVSHGVAQNSLWGPMMNSWPGTAHLRQRLAGTLLPPDAILSNAVDVWVERRNLCYLPEDPEHLVGAQWEPWFTPRNADWSTAQAVPLMGFYHSWNPDVTRQQMLWLTESGIDFLVVDWTNQLWDKEHFSECSDSAREIIHSTILALESLAAMRDEGIRVPKTVLYLGLTNGPSTTMTAVNEEMAWIHENLVRNPRYAGLFVDYLGKPLLLIHNGGGPQWLSDHRQPRARDDLFTVRWQASQLEHTHFDQHGYWSWMDSSLTPVVTYHDGQPEALTVSTACFGPRGWKHESAYGRRGGWTFVEGFKSALAHRPRFLELHQYQEFAGQREGSGYGPQHEIYVDSYSVELSDDIEPVSLTTPAYRGQGGWGFYFLNLTRALVDLYRQETPQTTVAVISTPRRGDVVTSDQLPVEWTWVGKPPSGFTLLLNGKTVARNLHGNRATLDLSRVSDGPATLTLIAEGTQARYALSYTQDELPADLMPRAQVAVEFTLQRERT